MKSLFLAWQAPNRAWFPVGRLDADVAQQHYHFGYTKGALQAEHAVGFRPLPAFPDFERTYESSELFPLFQNRVLDSSRKDFGAYLASLDLPPSSADPIEILAVSGGERQTDSLEVFPRIESRPDGAFRCRFFLHGWRHMSQASQSRAMALEVDEPLGVSLELTKSCNTRRHPVNDERLFIPWLDTPVSRVRSVDRHLGKAECVRARCPGECRRCARQSARPHRTQRDFAGRLATDVGRRISAVSAKSGNAIRDGNDPVLSASKGSACVPRQSARILQPPLRFSGNPLRIHWMHTRGDYGYAR